MRDLKNIDLNTELFRGDIIYTPKKQKYYEIEDVGYEEIYREIIVNFKPENNFEENGFKIRFSYVIHFGYQHVVIS